MLLSPGVEIQTLDLSYYIGAVPTTFGAMIGVTEKGPINSPTLLTSWEQFYRTFGGVISSSYMPDAARRALDGGCPLFVVRVAHYTDIDDKTTLTATKASATLVDRLAEDTLTVEASSEGAWANGATDGLQVTIENSGLDSTNQFDMKIYLAGTLVEYYQGMSMRSTNEDYAVKKVNNNSMYVILTDLDSTNAAPDNRPAVISLSSLSGGSDGTTIADTDYIGSSSSKTGFNALDPIPEVNFLGCPGVTSVDVVAGGIAYAESRQDCFFVCETPSGLTPLQAVAYRKGETGDYTHAAWNSSYAVLYYPWLEIRDSINGGYKVIPPMGDVFASYAYTDTHSKSWFAPAGLQRGNITGIHNFEYPLGQETGGRDLLYNSSINPLVSLGSLGSAIWGQKTLKTTPSALDRLNVRRLLIYVERGIRRTMYQVLFELNDEILWRSVVRMISPVMRIIQNERGLVAFEVKCDKEVNTSDTIDRNELHVRIILQPTKAAEFIYVQIVITQTGVSFSEILRTS